MKVESIAECSPWIIGLENQFLVFLRVAVLHRFYCISNEFAAVLAVPNLALDVGEQFLHCLCSVGKVK